MKILVTGADGFIGRHLVRELLDGDHDVVGIDLEEGDLREPGVIEGWLDYRPPDACIHLAAKVGRLFGEDDRQKTIADNAGMTSLVAHACGERGIRFVYASTSEVYGDQGEHVCIEEGSLALPHNLYGLSKRWGEELGALYAPDGLTILRFSMPYGPGLPAGRGRAALVNFLDCAQREEPLTVHAGAERSWCWIGDTVRGVRMILESGLDGAWNIGRDDNRTAMADVARMACDLVGAPHSLIQEVDAPPRQTVVKRLSNAKLCSLGWRPEVELPAGMALTLAGLLS